MPRLFHSIITKPAQLVTATRISTYQKNTVEIRIDKDFGMAELVDRCYNHNNPQFASIANNGSATQTKSDAEVFSSVKMTIQNDGKVAIGTVSTASNDYRLFVQKGIATGKIFVNSSYADYVFLPDYSLPTLAAVKNHIQLHGHLPGMPSQAEIDAAGGFEVGQIAVKQMEKIEELYLYVLQLHDRIAELEDQIQTTSTSSHE